MSETTVETGARAIPNGVLAEPETNSSTMFGYCGGCGTWAAHSLTCACCGYDFNAKPSPFVSDD